MIDINQIGLRVDYFVNGWLFLCVVTESSQVTNGAVGTIPLKAEHVDVNVVHPPQCTVKLIVAIVALFDSSVGASIQLVQTTVCRSHMRG